MGLDMYLERINRQALEYKDEDLCAMKVLDCDKYAKIKQYIVKCGDPEIYSWESLFEEVAYWRKANHIHHWFVENIQDDVDDCGDYEVSREDLLQLSNCCKKVLDFSVLIPKGTHDVLQVIDGKFVNTPTPYCIIENPEVALELLPVASGFFFGSEDYDEYYLKEIEYTIEIIDTILNSTDFESETIFYRSSW